MVLGHRVRLAIYGTPNAGPKPAAVWDLWSAFRVKAEGERTANLEWGMSIPLDLQRKSEQRWLVRFARPHRLNLEGTS